MSITSARNLLITALGAATLLPTVGCDMEGPLILQHGKQARDAYEDLAAAWVRWAMITPNSTNPIADATGEFCDVGQGDGQWFLTGSFGGPVERDCTIPSDTRLFLPLINRWGFAFNEWIEADPANYDEFVQGMLAWQADSRANTCDLTLRVDGVDLLDDTAERDDKLYVALTEPFSIELNDDNWYLAQGYEVPGGTYDYTLADGHWALFRPLSPGEHLLEVGGTICDPGGAPQFTTSATYHLDVLDDG